MNTEFTDIVQDIISRFSQKNIRLTPQRIGVYRFLLENRIHPTVDTVYHSLKSENPSLSKTTIYNTVDTLAEAGLVRLIRASEGEVRLDAYVDRHGHFICTQCGEIADFSLDGCSMPESMKQFQIADFEVQATGLCPRCM
jgi:Fe2+ or Zn2+ uptake regulation protein